MEGDVRGGRLKEGVEGSSSGGRLYPTNKSSNIQVVRSLRTHPGASSDGTALFSLLRSMITGKRTALWGPMWKRKCRPTMWKLPTGIRAWRRGPGTESTIHTLVTSPAGTCRLRTRLAWRQVIFSRDLLDSAANLTGSQQGRAKNSLPVHQQARKKREKYLKFSQRSEAIILNVINEANWSTVRPDDNPRV